MLLHGVNDNILIYCPSYLSVYQDESKKRALRRDKYIFWVGTKPQKKLTNCGACYSWSNQHVENLSTTFLKGVLV